MGDKPRDFSRKDFLNTLLGAAPIIASDLAKDSTNPLINMLYSRLLPYDFTPRFAKERLERVIAGNQLISTLKSGNDLTKAYTDELGGLQGDRLLILYSDKIRRDVASNKNLLVKFMEEYLDLNVKIKHISEYKPKIDEYIHDGIILVNANYNTAPEKGCLEDIANTQKPVLWINYHGWLIPSEFLSESGIVIEDKHSSGYSLVELQGIRDLKFTEVSVVQAPENLVLYNLINPKNDQSTPGAIHSNNFTYISYLPTFDKKAEDFIPLLTSLQTTFGTESPRKIDPLPNYQQRLNEAKKSKLKKGLIIPLYANDSLDNRVGYDSHEIHENLVRIKESGADWVSALFLFYQEHNSSSEVFADSYNTPSLDSVKNFVEDAHDLGLKVMLKANLNSQLKEPYKWSGTIDPEDPVKWWKSYYEMIYQLTKFSIKNDVESLGIGLELTKMEGMTDSWFPEYNSDPSNAEHWRQLIKNVKSWGYKGLVSYQANFDVFEKVPWAGELDHFGIAAYFRLTPYTDPTLLLPHINPTLNQLLRGWKEPIKRMKKWAIDNPFVPFEIFEIGYASQSRSSMEPFLWSPNKDSDLNLEEQRVCFEALYHVINETPEIKGIHYFGSLPGEPNPKDRRYMIFGKPAEEYMLDVFNIER